MRFSTEPVEARMGDCQCVGTPHTGGDVAYLNPRLSFIGGERGTALVRNGLDDTDEASIQLIAMYLRNEVQGWNLVDADGNPVPFDAEVLLTDWEAASAVGEAADGLYSASLMRPLLAAVSRSSQAGQTESSTSVTKTSTARRRKP